MTERNRAKDIVLAAKALTHEDALRYVEEQLKLVFTQGERAGLEQARQLLINQLEPVA